MSLAAPEGQPPRQVEGGEPAPGAHPKQEDLLGDPPVARFRGHMRRAGALVAEGKLGEAEGEILVALGLWPGDVRALKLLALVRFRLGRLVEAREAYRAVVESAPEDFAGRLNLGLIALKLEWFEEAAAELVAAVRLRPDDQRALGYLGYAQARAGQVVEAAESFRRAGQPGLALEVAASLGNRSVASPAGAVAPQVGEAAGPSPQPPEPEGPVAPVPLADFALGRLLAPADAPVEAAGAVPAVWAQRGIRRVPVEEEIVVRRGALVAALGGLRTEALSGRRGAAGEDTAPFLRCRGRGEVWLGGAVESRGPLTLELEEDVLFVRQSELLGFWGEIDWETGAVPRTPVRLVQLRGTGRLMVDWPSEETLALRLRESERVCLLASRLRGWIGHIVVQPDSTESRRTDPLVACEGEGVLLIARHGQLSEPVHERAEPGDDGARRPDPHRLAVHR